MREPRADRDVAVPGQQRRDEREQRAQIRREIDVHVGDHARGRARPRCPQRAAAALAGEPQRLDVRQLGGEARGDPGRRVRAGVVGDDDVPAEREAVAEEVVQAAHVRLQRRLLVVDGNDDIEVRRGGHATSLACGRQPGVGAA